MENEKIYVIKRKESKFPVSLRFQTLTDAQQKDSLFDNYDAVNREKIRSSFRLPPI